MSIPGVRESLEEVGAHVRVGTGAPPMPPVAPTAMPARAAAQIVALTVVAPRSPEESAIGTSRRATLFAAPGSQNLSRSASLSPTTTVPSTAPIHAGTQRRRP